MHFQRRSDETDSTKTPCCSVHFPLMLTSEKFFTGKHKRMAVVLTVVNNSTAVTNGFYGPRFTMHVKGLDTRNKTLNLESAQFELHFENVSDTTNKLYVKSGNGEDKLSILTGTYTDIEDLISVINETLSKAGHSDIVFTYNRRTCRVSVSVVEGKTCSLKSDSPGLVLGVGEIAKSYDIKGSHTFRHAIDLSKGRRFVLLYTDLIGPSVEYEDNVDSRVLKTFLIQTLNGVNNYVFGKDDKRSMLSYENVSQMTFWLKFNTGELITSGYPIALDLRIE